MLFVRALLVGYWSHVEEPQDKLQLSSGQEEDGGQDEGSVTNTRGECQQTGLGRRNAFVETCRDNINCDLLQCSGQFPNANCILVIINVQKYFQSFHT